MIDILISTTNIDKLYQINQIINNPKIQLFSIKTLRDSKGLKDYDAPEESGDTYFENAKIKAEYGARWSGMITLAEDSGFEVDCLGGKPGLYSARFGKSDQERISRVIKEVNEARAKSGNYLDLGARYVSFSCIATPSGEIYYGTGESRGSVLLEPKGNKGFGYDPVFSSQNYGGKTFAELDQKEVSLNNFRAESIRQVFDNFFSDNLRMS